jgi:hypothetical protein
VTPARSELFADPERREQFGRPQLIKQTGAPPTSSGLPLFTVADAVSLITGANFVIDGGITTL